MADFATWVVAAEPALPLETGTFLAAYTRNRATVVEHSLEGDPVAVALRKFMECREEWKGTATDLLGELTDVAGDLVSRSKAWPKAANYLSNRIRRAATFLRASDIAVDWEENSRPRLISIRKRPQKTVGTVQGPSARKTSGSGRLDDADDTDDEKHHFSKEDEYSLGEVDL
jgi:hypothetical protein